MMVGQSTMGVFGSFLMVADFGHKIGEVLGSQAWLLGRLFGVMEVVLQLGIF
jgi:hypothetical protein